ncbi:hypothetical protein MMC25_006895 [Agyrium rufum]|nr:hypothetical protein [Agyrium rufum]
MSKPPSHNSNAPRIGDRNPSPPPPRYVDRRPPNNPSSVRNNDTPYRPDDYPHRELVREPPKGPKAQIDGGRGGASFTPRGRGGYPGRFDPRDRDARDGRDGPYIRRDDNRDWNRRDQVDHREQRLSPSRLDRDRSPLSTPYREARETDAGRADPDIRDRGPGMPPFVPDPPHSSGPFVRGGFRGRGRGDFSGRGRGRGGFQSDERDRFAPRSRSRDRNNPWPREGPRDFRDDRPRDRERDWETGRRDFDDRRIREDQDREMDRSRKDLGAYRSASRNSDQSLNQPVTPQPSQQYAAGFQQGPFDRSGPRNPNLAVDTPRAMSISSGPSGLEQTIKDEPPREPVVVRRIGSQDGFGGSTPSSPPQAPQIPAFGSIGQRVFGSSGTESMVTNPFTSRPDNVAVDGSRGDKPDPVKVAPTGPKALIAQQQNQYALPAPSGPRTDYPDNRPPSAKKESPSFRQDPAALARGSGQISALALGSPSAPRYGALPRQLNPGRPLQTQGQFGGPQALVRSSDTRPSMQNPFRPGPAESGAGYGAPRPNTWYDQHDSSSSKTPAKVAEPSHISPTAPPVGPRFHQGPPPARAIVSQSKPPRFPVSAHGFSNKIWVNPEISQLSQQSQKHAQPSIMNRAPPTKTPAKRDYLGQDRSPEATEKTIPESQNLLMSTYSDESNLKQEEADSPDSSSAEFGTDKEDAAVQVPSDPMVTEPEAETLKQTTKAQLESASDEDDGMDLDEADLEEADKKFNNELEALEAKRPPTPRHHPELLQLLEELDALASAAEDIANGRYVPLPEQPELIDRKPETGLLSPEPEQISATAPLISDPYLSTIVRDDDSDSSSNLGDLPYLISGPPTPFSEIECVRDGRLQFEEQKDTILAYLAQERDNLYISHEDLREEYARLYRPWRLKVDELDRQKKLAQEVINTATASPVPIESPVIATTPLIEGRRTGRFVSELELQRVIQESKIAAEAEEIREKELQESKALADLAKEAVIPDMLDPRAVKLDMFQDRNHFVPTDRVLAAFAFEEKVDDFTLEEHKIFTDFYLRNPKRWGWIATALPNRDYTECIKHYYLTKKTANYKAQVSKKLGKRGRRAGRAQARPKANALMSNIGSGNQLLNSTEVDAPVSVTDTGRPRRTAAPTFGATTTDSEAAQPPTTSTRRGPAQPKFDANGELIPEKPKRTRNTQPKERTKRGKGQQLLAAAPIPSMTKQEPETPAINANEPTVEEGPNSRELEEAQLLAGFQQSGSAQQTIAYPNAAPSWLSPVRPADVPFSPEKPMNASSKQSPILSNQSQLMAEQIQASNQASARNAVQTSSYWSVPENQDFPALVAYFGHDWQSIANHLKNKTPVMVKNHFYRSLDAGKPELEAIAIDADEKRRIGAPRGEPPPPTVAQKRRYETTPQTMTPRVLAPSTMASEQEIENQLASQATPLQPTSQRLAHSPPQIAPHPPPPANPNQTPMPTQTSAQRQGTQQQQQQQQPSQFSKPSHPSKTQRLSLGGGPPLAFPERDPRPILQAAPISTATTLSAAQPHNSQQDTKDFQNEHSRFSDIQGLNAKESHPYPDTDQQRGHGNIQSLQPSPQRSTFSPRELAVPQTLLQHQHHLSQPKVNVQDKPQQQGQTTPSSPSSQRERQRVQELQSIQQYPFTQHSQPQPQPLQMQHASQSSQGQVRATLGMHEFHEAVTRQHVDRFEKDNKSLTHDFQTSPPQQPSNLQPYGMDLHPLQSGIMTQPAQMEKERGLKPIPPPPPPPPPPPSANSRLTTSRYESTNSGLYGTTGYNVQGHSKSGSMVSPTQAPPRPSSVPAGTALPPPPPSSTAPTRPTPTPTPAKRSNLMSLLNDDPPEPPARKPSQVEIKPPPSSASVQSAPIPPPPYQQQQSTQSASSYGRQEYGLDASRSQSVSHPSYPQLSYISRTPPVQTQDQFKVEPSGGSRDPMANAWQPGNPRSLYDGRPSLSLLDSPRQQPLFEQSLSRPSSQLLQPSRQGGSPKPTPSTSRAVSYSGLQPHPHQPHQQANSGPLHPSPYSQTTHHPSQLQPHPQQPQQQNPYTQSSMTQPPRAPSLPQSVGQYKPPYDNSLEERDRFLREEDRRREGWLPRSDNPRLQDRPMWQQDHHRQTQAQHPQQLQQQQQEQQRQEQQRQEQQRQEQQRQAQAQMELMLLERRNQERRQQQQIQTNPIPPPPSSQQNHPYRPENLLQQQQENLRRDAQGRTFTPPNAGYHDAYRPPPPPPPPPGQSHPGQVQSNQGRYEDMRR